MRKRFFSILLCCALVLLCSCNTRIEKYKRISFESETMGEQLKYIKEDTVVVNKVEEMFPTHIPVYEIRERSISDVEYQKMCVNLDLEDNRYFDFEFSGNYLYISLASVVAIERGFFEMSEEEGEKLAWEVFNKIPFMEGEYECIGIKDRYTLRDDQGTHIARAGFVFCRVLDGVRVVDGENCTLYFDGSGLVAISIRLFDYEKVGTMEMVSLDDARAKLKSPDDFDVGTASSQPLNKELETLQIEKVSLRLVNQ